MKRHRDRRSILYMGYASHRIRRELARRASRHNWTVTFGHFDDFDARAYARQVRIDGLISHGGEPDGTARLLKAVPGLPCIALTAGVPEALDVPGVVMDHRAAGYLVGQHFVELGFENCLAIGRRDHVLDLRYQGLSQAVAEAGFRAPRHLEVPLSEQARFDKLLPVLVKMLRDIPLPVAIMARRDNLATMLIHACQLCELAVPAQVAICGFDNDPIACEMAPMPLSSIDTNPELQVRETARIMEDLLNGRPPPRETILIPPAGLVVRQTSGAVAAADPTLSRALSYIHSHIQAPDLSIGEIAEAVGVSDVSLFAAFRRADCGTPLQYITNIRLTNAKALLRETGKHIDDIRAECGFSSYNQMYKAFKRMTGVSPGSIRSPVDPVESSLQSRAEESE